jgi:hypothetical protein
MPPRGRPRLEDRSKAHVSTLTLKVSEDERALLARLAEDRARELHELTGQRIPVTISALLRWLAEQEAGRRGLLEPSVELAPSVQTTTKKRRTKP